MLIQFTLSNYRSFLESNQLSMEARGIREYRESLIDYSSRKFLPVMAVYGKNGGGKSNLMRGFWLGVAFILNAQRTQHTGAPVPVNPFLLNDTAKNIPTTFEYTYVHEGIKYCYGFSATRKAVVEEHLFHYPKKQKAIVFQRTGDEFYFPAGSNVSLKRMISRATASNQLFFAVANTMNESSCIKAMQWFRERVFFTRGYNDVNRAIVENRRDDQVLNAMKNYALHADLGIEKMEFTLEDKPINSNGDAEKDNSGNDDAKKEVAERPERIKAALATLIEALSESPNASELSVNQIQLKAVTYHKGINSKGEKQDFQMSLSDESDGTRRLMALAPEFENALRTGGLLIADEPEIGIHPLLLEQQIRKFQNPKTNPHHAQVIFTTHDTNFLKLDFLRRDQFAFVDKDRDSGVSELYALDDLRNMTSANAENSYLLGKFGAVPDVEDID